MKDGTFCAVATEADDTSRMPSIQAVASCTDQCVLPAQENMTTEMMMLAAHAVVHIDFDVS